MKNSADLGGCYPQRPKAEVDNTLLDPTRPHSIAKYRAIENTTNQNIGKTLCNQ